MAFEKVVVRCRMCERQMPFGWVVVAFEKPVEQPRLSASQVVHPLETTKASSALGQEPCPSWPSGWGQRPCWPPGSTHAGAGAGIVPATGRRGKGPAWKEMNVGVSSYHRWVNLQYCMSGLDCVLREHEVYTSSGRKSLHPVCYCYSVTSTKSL